MPTKVEKDTFSGTETTGHEWDGIKELDTPLPKWWVYVFYATIVWSLVYYVLYPAIPGITGFTHGVLGWSQRAQIVEELAKARSAQASYIDRIAASTPAQIQADPELLNFSLSGGRAAFADNCAPCHAPGGAGRPGFPTLADDAWLWGGTLDDIQTTILYGIRSGNEQARESEMPAFGGVLEPGQISDVAEYVLSLSGHKVDAEAAARGKSVFADNCAACHGDDGGGNQDVGAPALNDHVWLYGGTKADIMAQVTKPKLGVMPAWKGRLDGPTIKMLTVYVHSLGGGQ
jgi:cytochrome c oxidase cbb3-type subunit 3